MTRSVRAVAFFWVALLCAPALAAEPKPAQPAEESSNTSMIFQTLTPAEGKEHRYFFVGAAISAGIGFGLTYWAQGEVRRANSLALATDARRTYQTAQTTIAGANLLFCVAGAFAVYALLAEFLPASNDGTLTLSF